MSATNHPWCRDVPRDEAVRAAEDAAAAERTPVPDHRELPAAVAELRERVARLEDHFADASKMVTPKPAPPSADGLRTERVTLEIKHFDDNDSDSVRHWNWSEMMSEQGLGINESVRVVEETHCDDIAQVVMERDAALRERDAAKEECGRLRHLLKTKESECETHHPWVHPSAAPAANAGGEKPVLWGVVWGHKDLPEDVDTRNTKEEALNLAKSDHNNGTVVPLYAAPPEPRGWLNSEERRTLANFVTGLRAAAAAPFHDEAVRSSLTKQANDVEALLARATPPKVRRPMPWHFHAVESEDEENQTARDRQWEDAIREAGGEVEE